MAKSLDEWVTTEVQEFQDRSVAWLSEYYFFRDPPRPSYSDTSCFFSPADGIILYQHEVEPDESIVDIKGKSYSLRDAMRDDDFGQRSLVIGIFMTFFDVHVNRVPFPGRLSYRELDPIDTYNHPMLDVEKNILSDLRVSTKQATYLHNNQRMLNRVCSSQLGHTYYILQIADYDVDCILPFELKQNRPCFQGQRFSTIRYGSQVDLIVPLSDRYEFTPIQETGHHVEAGIDPLVRITAR